MDLLLLNLCCLEFIQNVTALVRYSSMLHKGTYTESKESTFIMGNLIPFNIFHGIILITIDRVLAIRLGMRYKIYVTKRRLIVAVTVSWLTSILLSCTIWFGSWNAVLVMWATWDCFMASFLVASYTYIIFIVRSRRRKLNSISSTVQIRKIKYQVPSLIVLSYILLYLTPNVTLAIIPDSYCVWFFVSWYMNYLSDALIYVICSRRALKREGGSVQYSSARKSSSEAIICTSSI